MQYMIRKAARKPPLNGDFEDAAWVNAGVIDVNQFHEQSSDHRPMVQAKAIYHPHGICVSFQVDDQYVVSRQTEHQKVVCYDSCVEFFFKPKAARGYMNFEFNCGGNMFVAYNEIEVIDGERVGPSTVVEPEWLEKVGVYHSMPNLIDPEITEPTQWQLQFDIPFAMIAHYCGLLGDISGQAWRANFYKCADKCSHPHWASWASVGERLDFHQADRFGTVRFEL